jgi:hypothetical protein
MQVLWPQKRIAQGLKPAIQNQFQMLGTADLTMLESAGGNVVIDHAQRTDMQFRKEDDQVLAIRTSSRIVSDLTGKSPDAGPLLNAQDGGRQALIAPMRAAALAELGGAI